MQQEVYNIQDITRSSLSHPLSLLISNSFLYTFNILIYFNTTDKNRHNKNTTKNVKQTNKKAFFLRSIIILLRLFTSYMN